MDSPATDTFIKNVRDYCHWVESTTHDLATVRRLLPVLMDGAQSLEESNSSDKNDLPPYRPNDWEANYLRFRDFPFQFYKVLWMERDLDEDGPFNEDIHRDFADIYADLAHGLQAFDRGDETHAVRHWRSSYFRHWGHHASSAICAMDWHLGVAKPELLGEVSIGGAPRRLPSSREPQPPFSNNEPSV